MDPRDNSTQNKISWSHVGDPQDWSPTMSLDEQGIPEITDALVFEVSIIQSDYNRDYKLVARYHSHSYLVAMVTVECPKQKQVFGPYLDKLRTVLHKEFQIPNDQIEFNTDPNEYFIAEV